MRPSGLTLCSRTLGSVGVSVEMLVKPVTLGKPEVNNGPHTPYAGFNGAYALG
jgi:hypothetical protein